MKCRIMTKNFDWVSILVVFSMSLWITKNEHWLISSHLSHKQTCKILHKKSPRRNNECLLISCQEMRHDVRPGVSGGASSINSPHQAGGPWVSHQPAPTERRRENQLFWQELTHFKWNSDFHSEVMSILNTCRVCVVGDRGVGKTSLIKRFLDNHKEVYGSIVKEILMIGHIY